MTLTWSSSSSASMISWTSMFLAHTNTLSEGSWRWPTGLRSSM